MITQSQVLAHEQKLFATIQSRDLPALDALVHEKLLFIAPGGVTVTKAMELEVYKGGDMRVDSITPGEYTIQLAGDTAIVAVTAALKGSYFGQPIDGNFRYLRVWKWEEDRLQIIAGSVTPVQEA